MNLKIAVICPANAVTGGPEALHQLVSMSNEVDNGSAAICYMPDELSHEVPEPYKKYNTPVVKIAQIPDSAVVIIPELWPYMVNNFNQRCALWWLSVDNFVCSDLSVVQKYQYHITQSYYAYKYVSDNYFKKPIMVTDYIHADRLSNEIINVNRKNRIAVNPAKGAHLIDEFISMNPDIEVIRLQGMSEQQISKELSESLIYVDFGHHPGKDRLPREAAACGCVVLSRNIGAAANKADMPIDDLYKFNDIEKVGSLVNEIFNNAEKHIDNQKQYKMHVLNQKEIFKNEVYNFLQEIGK